MALMIIFECIFQVVEQLKLDSAYFEKLTSVLDNGIHASGA
jgi:hypothetical protein